MLSICTRRIKSKTNDFLDKWPDYLDNSNVSGYSSWVPLLDFSNDSNIV